METSSHPARQGQAAALLMLVLFYVTHNVGTVFFQARNVPPQQSGAAVAAYFAGILAGALIMVYLECRKAWRSTGKSGTVLRAFFLFLLLFPSIFCEISLRLTGYQGTAFLNFFQPLIWAAHLPVAMLFFFRHVRADRQALFFSIAISAGHLCWALIMPLVAASSGPESLSALANRVLPLLSLTRNIAGAAFAALCWRLAEQEARTPASSLFSGLGLQPEPRSSGVFPFRHFALLLSPFLACFLVNGFTGYLFFPRLLGRGLYPEYMHLALALLFPLAGMVLRRGRDGALWGLTGFATLAFAVLPLLLQLSIPAWVTQAVYLICAASQQVLLYCGVLAFARFAPFSRFPALSFCAVWLAAAVSVPGRLLASTALPALSVPIFPVACLLGAACALALFPLRRAFPLPMPPASEVGYGPVEEAPDQADAAKLEVLRLEAEAKLYAFSAAFGLSRREIQVLEGVLRGLEREAMGAELGISVRTVQFHIGGVLRKTGTSNRQRLLNFYAAWRDEQARSS